MDLTKRLPSTGEDKARVWVDILNQREITNDEVAAFRSWRAEGERRTPLLEGVP